MHRQTAQLGLKHGSPAAPRPHPDAKQVSRHRAKADWVRRGLPVRCWRRCV